MTDKKYINWICKEVQFNNWWSIINISLKLEDLKELVNEKGYINMTLNKRKEPGKFGETHFLTLNEYKKETKKVNEFWDEILDSIPF